MKTLNPLLLFVLIPTFTTIGNAAPPNVDLNESEQKFVDLLTGATLSGAFTFDGKKEAAPKSENYQIQSATKLDGDNWIITASMSYKDVKVPVPVPVQVRWAGDTPMLQLTELTIPLVGEGFTARILFYGDRYAGTWQHGRVGGHMFGTVERTPNEDQNTGAAPASKLPKSSDSQ